LYKTKCFILLPFSFIFLLIFPYNFFCQNLSIFVFFFVHLLHRFYYIYIYIRILLTWSFNNKNINPKLNVVNDTFFIILPSKPIYRLDFQCVSVLYAIIRIIVLESEHHSFLKKKWKFFVFFVLRIRIFCIK